jgi:antitoxin component YwqK of YwqJK toxin-antitoxin module
MKPLFLLLLTILCTPHGIAQQHLYDTTYFDNNWHPTTKAKSQYYRLQSLDTVTMAPDRLIKIRDHYSTGALKMEGYVFVNDTSKRIGLYSYFSPKGKPVSLYMYDYNRSIDHFINHNSYLQKIEPCIEDVDLGISLYLDGHVKHSGFYLSNEVMRGTFRKVCTWKRYNPYTKNIASIDDYEYGKPDGRHFRYHGNGKIWKEAYYKNGKKTGIWKRYRYNGELRKTHVIKP